MSKRRKLRLVLEILLYAAVILFLLLAVFPLFWMAISSIKPPGLVFATPPVWRFTPTLENYAAALGGGGRGWGRTCRAILSTAPSFRCA